MKERYKTVNVSLVAWKLLKQYALDTDSTIKEVIEKLVEENIKG